MGRAPPLPSSVRVLTTVNNRISTVPVRWQALPDGATVRPGEVVVGGTTALGKVTPVVGVL